MKEFPLHSCAVQWDGCGFCNSLGEWQGGFLNESSSETSELGRAHHQGLENHSLWLEGYQWYCLASHLGIICVCFTWNSGKDLFSKAGDLSHFFGQKKIDWWVSPSCQGEKKMPRGQEDLIGRNPVNTGLVQHFVTLKLLLLWFPKIRNIFCGNVTLYFLHIYSFV